MNRSTCVMHPVVLWLDSLEDSAEHEIGINAGSPDFDEKPYLQETNDDRVDITPANNEPMKLMLKDGSLRHLHLPSNIVIRSTNYTDSSPISPKHINASDNDEAYVPPQKRQKVSIDKMNDRPSGAAQVANTREEKAFKEPKAGRKASSVRNMKTVGKRGTTEPKKQQSAKTAKPKPYGFQKKERALDQPWR